MYHIVVRTQPGNVFPLSQLLLFRAELQSLIGTSRILKMSSPDDADIDADTVAGMIAEGRFTESEFVAFCHGFNVPHRRSDGDLHHLASHAFLEMKAKPGC
jgi:hypothetical protein